MENSTPPKPRVKHPDRVSLTPEALTRLSSWIREAESRLKGSRLTKSDLVNFLVMSHSASLSEKELEQLERDHFDDVRFAAWALRQIKEARAQGKDLSLADVVNAAPGAIPKTVKLASKP
jgi:hypothetical protein